MAAHCGLDGPFSSSASALESESGWLRAARDHPRIVYREAGLDNHSISLAIGERLDQHVARHHLRADANANAVSPGTIGLSTAFVDLRESDRRLGTRDGRVCNVLRLGLPHDERWRDVDPKRCSSGLFPHRWLL
jgi:hypothetical protein